MTQRAWAGAGLLLLALAAAAELALVAPLRAEQAALAALAPPAPRAGADAAAGPAAQLARFHAAFPPLAQLAEALAGLDAAALQAGLPLRAAEYRLEPPAGGGDARLARYRIALRTTGEYTQIRAFLGQLLQERPYVALDDAQFRRGADATLEAELRLSFYLRR